MDLIPLVLLAIAILIALGFYNFGWAMYFRDAWNESRSHARQPDAIDRLHELVTNNNLVRVGVPDYFRGSHVKAHLTGKDRPCAVCAPFRGRLYAYGDPEAPRLPLPDCENERGCTCEYV